MEPLAHFARASGFIVAGSDPKLSPKQKADFAKVHIKFHEKANPKHLASYDTIVYSTAIPSDHPEMTHIRLILEKEKESSIKLLHRMDFLNICLQKCWQSFAIAGTHGKSSSTAMLAWILMQFKVDPCVILGARPLFMQHSYALGSDKIGVYESDESDGSFLKSKAKLRLVSNIDADHLDFYGDMNALSAAFAKFCIASNLLCLNIQDNRLEKISKLKKLSAKLVFFSCFESDAEMRYYANSNPQEIPHYTGYFISDSNSLEIFVNNRNEEEEKNGKDIKHSLISLGKLHLKLIGPHFAKNALGVMALVAEAERDGFIDIPDFTIEKMLEIMNAFPGLERRLQKIASIKGMSIYDDYGHHPTEIECVISSLKRYQATKGRLIVIFQPHRYTRTAAMYKSFAKSLALADFIYLLPIYAASEKQLDNVSSHLILDCMSSYAREDACQVIAEQDIQGILTGARGKTQEGDILLALGAGSISQIIRLEVKKILEE